MNYPPILLSYQQSWLADDSPVKVYSKSRRIGISWAEAADAALYSAGGGEDNVWYIGYNQDMAREFVSDCAFWARHYQLAASEMEEAVFEGEGVSPANRSAAPPTIGGRRRSFRSPNGYMSYGGRLLITPNWFALRIRRNTSTTPNGKSRLPTFTRFRWRLLDNYSIIAWK